MTVGLRPRHPTFSRPAPDWADRDEASHARAKCWPTLGAVWPTFGAVWPKLAGRHVDLTPKILEQVVPIERGGEFVSSNLFVALSAALPESEV